MDRRGFLRSGAMGLALPSAFRAKAEEAADQAVKRVGIVGPGWYGKVDLLRLIQVAPVEVVSMADVDKRMLAEAADIVAGRQASGKKPRTYGDYREMLKEKDLDIVLVATPDHWHALPMIAAVEAGADVYVQKPISVDIAEGTAMLRAARKHGRVVQVGTQRRSTPHLIEARDEIVKSGKLGKIGFAEIYCYYHMRGNGSPPEGPPPDYLDWEMFVGPAPMRGYNPSIHPRGWRGYMEFSNGIIGDMCIHMLDTVRWMLDLGAPRTVSSAGGIVMGKGGSSNTTDTQVATFEFDGLDVVWQHRTWGSSPDPQYPWGGTLYGDKGTLKFSINGYDFIPNQGPSIHRDVTMELEQYPVDKTEKDLERQVAPAVRYHMLDFLSAIANRSKPVADIEQGYHSTTACILANMSQKLGRSLAWDAENHRIVGDDEANKFLQRPYRDPWTHPSAASV
ncbi:Gfo/Idh/MocA family protein [Planctomyces sp. SH-PL62]|uniref:Gfo/Idh/MocA family protein n=1 Tax=Planctomyces sp. SH-PL62 TaxID=1636152 RepID=UPI00078ED00E|nr:Gfo/Idh/MocA family oxidoreductase [Planctomyces sp. SH-PL62]AMV39130.1 Inositol 2-dehydrogenase [Planctomyces sp. SH-PL62]